MSYQEAKELADHFNVRFFETSAKESLNVEDAFTTMTREIMGHVATSPSKRSTHGMVGTEIIKDGTKEDAAGD